MGTTHEPMFGQCLSGTSIDCEVIWRPDGGRQPMLEAVLRLVTALLLTVHQAEDYAVSVSTEGNASRYENDRYFLAAFLPLTHEDGSLIERFKQSSDCSSSSGRLTPGYCERS